MVGKVEARGRSRENGAARVLKSLYQGVRLLPVCLFSPFTITERKHHLKEWIRELVPKYSTAKFNISFKESVKASVALLRRWYLT